MKYSTNKTIDEQRQKKYETIKSTLIPRATIIALIIGSIINLVNQYDAFFASGSLQILALLLTYLTPFAVVLYAQHTALNRAFYDIFCERSFSNDNNLFLTSISHDIPEKAIVIGLVAGSINSAILLIANYINSDGINELPTPQMVQFYLIPLFFGVLTQTLFYQRTISIFNNQEGQTIVTTTIE